jgi:hypothetical protein
MDVELAEERILILPEALSIEQSEGRAWAKRIEAYGTMAKLTGFLSRPDDAAFEVIYRERRLQPFWHIGCTAYYAYERSHDYRVSVGEHVTEVVVEGIPRPVTASAYTVTGLERCCEQVERESWFDGISGAPDPALAAYLKNATTPGDAATLAAEAEAGVAVVPPQAKTSMLVRDVLAGAITRIEADTVTEERMVVHHIDLVYRPIHAFRYRWQGKEAVVEVDAVTGIARAGGSTFEHYVGKVLDAEFLLNAGVEMAGLFIPGARLAEIVISRSLKAGKAKLAH